MEEEKKEEQIEETKEEILPPLGIYIQEGLDVEDRFGA